LKQRRRRETVKARLLGIIFLTMFTIMTVSAAVAKSQTLGNQSPVASFIYLPAAPMPGETVLFDASSSQTSTGQITTYAWDFGDGITKTMTTPTVSHVFLADGAYTIALTVTDTSGESNSATVVLQVSTVIFFRVVIAGTTIPLANAKVTAYYKDDGTWKTITPGPSNMIIKYDNMTQPHLASTSEEKYRNPGFTASILRADASNIGFDIYPGSWNVYFKIEWGPYVTYWPNETTRVFSYKDGAIEQHNYASGHCATWDPSASTYVIRVNNIPKSGVAPTESHPIIVGLLCPPQPLQHYLTVNTSPADLANIPGDGWYGSGTSVPLTAPAYENETGTSRYRFSYWDVDGIFQGVGVNPVTVTMLVNHTTTAHYVKQYPVFFTQDGLDTDTTGTIVTINSTGKLLGDMPFTQWTDTGSSILYSYSPTVGSSVSGKQYELNGTTGPSSPVTVTDSSTVCGIYTIHYLTNGITFDQAGAAPDYTGTVVEIDGTPYGVTALPVSFAWQIGSEHNFTYHSPLMLGSNVKQYVWVNTSGLSNLQTGSIVVSTYGSVIGNYNTQFYLTIETDPSSIASPTGSGWYDSGTNATIDTPAFIDIISGSSRYRFNGWTTGNMSEISDPSRSPTTVTVDEVKTVTATYAAQYVVTFSQSGVGSEFTNTIVTIDTIDYNQSGLPTQFMWDEDTMHNYEFKSPLVITVNSKRYIWTGTTGLSTQQSETITVAAFGTIVGNFCLQYHLAVGTNPPGIATIPGEGWYNESASVMLTAPTVPNYTFDRWYVNGVPQGAGVNAMTLTMNNAYVTEAHYSPIAPCVLTITTTSGGTTNPAPGAYNYSLAQTVQVVAITNSGYVLDHWELDATNVSSSNNPITVTMNTNHNLKAVFKTAPPPPTVVISPESSTLNPGQSAQFTCTVNGGTAPYQYQWYLDGTPILGATSNTWTFTATTTAIHYVQLKLTDALNNTALSNNAQIIVTSPVPVGGYAISYSKQRQTLGLATYTLLIAAFTTVFIATKRKKK
jgi:PKD domain/Divergent InlB B-repeat domain/Immunoglobulin domain